ncbi:MAG TPA: peptidylprolyl isomerase [Gemmatimonadaceae bacterium]|nr:peptidylprolyl isomerase [Gemmatimonadaceae bacterium]
MKRSLIALAASVALLAGCEGFKEAMTAHVDVAARAGSQELSVERLANMLGNSKIPLSEDNAKAISNIWVNYQLLGEAAARGDSLNDPKLLDQALWPIIAQQRVGKFHEQVSKSWTVDTAGGEARYNQGDLLSAQHILFPVQNPAQDDSVRRVAESVRAQVTSANFADMARRYSGDPGSKDRGGIYPAFPKGSMVPEFEKAVTSLKPGEIAPGLVKTNFGYHIIRRPTYAEVSADYSRAAAQQGVAAAESTYLAKVMKGGDVKFRKDAAATIRKVIASTDDARNDNTVIATSKAGDFTAAKLARWIKAFPPQQQQMLRGQVAQAPDSLLVEFTKEQFIQNELLLHAADSAKVQMTPAETADLHKAFATLLERVWGGLGISPRTLADSAKDVAGRERIAAAQIDAYLEALMADRAQFVDVPVPLQDVLREKYDYKINQAGITRALERAQQIRAANDSTARAARPQSQVPLQTPPAAQPQAPAKGEAPPARQPAGTPPAAKQP